MAKHFSTLSQPNTCVRTEAGRARSRKSTAHALGKSWAPSASNSADVKHAISTVLCEFLRPHYARGTVDHDLFKHILSRAVNQVHRIIIHYSFYIACMKTFTLVRELHSTCIYYIWRVHVHDFLVQGRTQDFGSGGSIRKNFQ